MEASRLSAIPLFAELAPDDLEALARVASEVEAAAGETIAAEDQFGHALYAIESGSVEVTKDGETLRTLGAGEIFGEIAVVAAGRRTATVVATSPLRLIAIFKSDVWALEQRSPETAAELRRIISARSS
jgi:CRP-like cAMP-binding protein